MRDLETLSAYRILTRRTVRELNSEGYVLEHKKSGARLFLLSNEDDNKVFSIGFRTPPYDSTGVPHILEHSVLCGSEKFPVKDPFVELVKGSLNTFLNAMTYPDKTVYPIASTNEKDFHNLMDVYMDAVLHPNIYKEEKIFRQEGWHYELESEDGPLTYNGVVYNEMKGAFSSPESVLDRLIQQTLFPDTCYGVESGGDPKNIPDLTYEQFLNFHRTYYHPSNSFIYLYGDMDMAEKLEWLDQEYLSHYDRNDREAQIDSHIPMQKGFDAPKEVEAAYSITEEEDEDVRTSIIRAEMLSFIEAHYREDISMQDAATALRYSDAYFCKRFKQCFKVNFSAYLNEYRVGKARQLVLDPRLSLKDVSTACGYADANYFTRVFKRITGKTPSEYRLENLNN